MANFLRNEACSQKVLPDRSVLIGQKLVENAKLSKNSNETFWVIFKQCEFCEARSNGYLTSKYFFGCMRLHDYWMSTLKCCNELKNYGRHSLLLPK